GIGHGKLGPQRARADQPPHFAHTNIRQRSRGHQSARYGCYTTTAAAHPMLMTADRRCSRLDGGHEAVKAVLRVCVCGKEIKSLDDGGRWRCRKIVQPGPWAIDCRGVLDSIAAFRIGPKCKVVSIARSLEGLDSGVTRSHRRTHGELCAHVRATPART